MYDRRTGVACALILGMICNALAGIYRNKKENKEGPKEEEYYGIKRISTNSRGAKARQS